MSTVETVRGPVEISQLGPALAHEHIVTISVEFNKFYPELSWGGDRADVLRSVVGKLQEIRDRGITTILDCTAYFHGRDIDDILTRMFLRDITVGIADSGIRAQSIKVATDTAGFTPNNVRILRAAGRASAETGAPITAHTHPADRQAPRLLEILAEEERLEVLTTLCAEGYGRQVPSWLDTWVPTWVSDVILPALRKRGVSEDNISTLMVSTPASLFTLIAS